MGSAPAYLHFGAWETVDKTPARAVTRRFGLQQGLEHDAKDIFIA